VRSSAYLEDASSSEPSSPSSAPHNQSIIESNHSRSHNIPNLVPTIKTPLLMPPPTTTLSSMRHKISVYRHYAVSWAISNQQSIQLFGRLVVFVLKMIMLTKPCLPAVTREVILYPFMSLAALELAVWSKVSWRTVLTIFVVQLAVEIMATKWGGGLCLSWAPNPKWRWTSEE
jgi:hypothetical protein